MKELNYSEMNPEELREVQYKLIIAMLKEDKILRKQVKEKLKWWRI